MKNNLLLTGLLVLSSSSLFSAQPPLSTQAQALIDQARAITVTRNGDDITLTLDGKSQTLTPGSRKSTGAFDKIIVGVTFRDLFRATEAIKVNFYTQDKDEALFPGFEQMATEGYALILEKTV